MSLYSLFIFYILFPKVDLIGIGGSAVRITDLIYLVAVLRYLSIANFSFPRIPMANAYLLFVGFAVVSLLVNGGYFFGVLNILRFVQYMLWAYIGYEVSRSVNLDKFTRDMGYVAIFLLIWSTLEALLIVPKFGKFQAVEGRVSANTSGPFEIAVMASFLVFAIRRKMKFVPMTILFLTQARSTMGITLALMLRPYWKIALPFAVMILPIALLVPWGDLISQTRFNKMPTLQSVITSVDWYWTHTAPVVPQIQQEAMKSQERLLDQHLVDSGLSTVDASSEVRLWRWVIIVKSVFSGFIPFFFGYGPGIWGVGVDGYFMRVFGEFGLTGLVIFVGFLIAALRDATLDRTLRDYLLSMIGTAFFIDIFVTDKPMSLLWFYAGFVCAISTHKAAATPMVAPRPLAMLPAARPQEV